METMTTEELIKRINDRLDRIEKFTIIQSKNVLDIEECSIFTGMSMSHLYNMTSLREIPHFKRNRRLYFVKEDIERWLLEKRIPTTKEINSRASTFVTLNRKNNR